MNIIGIDLGGANIKAIDLHQNARSFPFSLWMRKNDLPQKLKDILSQYPQADLIALTMTGELADCFSSKAEGVRFITQSVVEAAGGIPISIWQTAGEFVPPEVAIEFPSLTAASNWHALASWVARSVDSTGLLIDIGSTTTDIIPIQDGLPRSTGLTDFERLTASELVYSGGFRTPLCALAHQVQINGQTVPLAAELFATTADIYLIQNLLPEEATCTDTADGRPFTVECSRQRIAKMVCCDTRELGSEAIVSIAMQLAAAQFNQYKQAMKKVLIEISEPIQQIILSGSSEFLARKLVESIPELSDSNLLSLSETFSPNIASAACAHAVTMLAAER